jgi:hypothetical protein
MYPLAGAATSAAIPKRVKKKLTSAIPTMIGTAAIDARYTPCASHLWHSS